METVLYYCKMFHKRASVELDEFEETGSETRRKCKNNSCTLVRRTNRSTFV